MTAKGLLTLTLVMVCGFIGGSISNRMCPVRAAVPEVVRASRFELVNESGKQIGSWGRDPGGQTVLTFVEKDGKEMAGFGLRSDDSPFLDMAGRDGKVRLTLRLGARDKPLLGMSDEKWEGRVLLGFIEHDVASPRSDDWGLLFRAPGSFSGLASIGVTSNPAGMRSGLLSVLSRTGKRWSVPE